MQILKQEVDITEPTAEGLPWKYVEGSSLQVMGKCSVCSSDIGTDNDHDLGADHGRRMCSNCHHSQESGHVHGATNYPTVPTTSSREKGKYKVTENRFGDDLARDVEGLALEGRDMDAGVADQLKRAIAASSEKTKILQYGVRLVDEKAESNAKKCKEQETVFKDLAKIVEKQEKTILGLQNTIAMQNVEIAQLSMKVNELSVTSFNGTLIWKITNYREKKRNAINHSPASFYSDCFYTSHYGYKMCGRVYLNGDGIGKGTHLSIFFAIKKGEYDSFLKWPFKQRVCFRLLNQSGGSHVEDAFRPDPTSSSFSRPETEMNIASGCPLFVSHEIIENPLKGFLKNDTIYLQIQVNTSDL